MKRQRFGFAVIAFTSLMLFGCIGLALTHNFISEDIRYFLSVIVCFVEAVLLLWSIYQAVIGIAGVMPLKKLNTELSTYPRILCLTAAHNEDAVIATHIRSLKSLNYPEDAYTIVVLADNCTDQTVRTAEAAGAIVWERHNLRLTGKGHALRWALHQKADLEAYDAVCFFDADNLVHPDFLTVMAKHVERGHMAIQGYLDTKNPWDSWVTTVYASSYWYMNRFWQRARAILGLSAAICGTGFCLSSRVLRQIPWEATSLTEDLEYTARLLLRGHRVHFAHDALVYDEKPIDYAATVPQRQRWMQGFWTTAFKYTKPLSKTAFSLECGWLRSVDLLIYTWQPVFVLLTGLNILFSLAEWCFGMKWFHPWLISLIPPAAWETFGFIGLALPITALILERAGWRAYVLFPLYLLFNVSWVPITIEAIRHLKSTEWVHTEHHRAISLEEIDKVS